MGRNSIGVSGFALTVSKAVRAQIGIRRMSGRDLAKAIGRGPTYVRERIADEKEWALGDLERMCKLWDMTPGQLIDSAPSVEAIAAPSASASGVDVDALADAIAADPDAFDLAANDDPYKEAEASTPRE